MLGDCFINLSVTVYFGILAGESVALKNVIHKNTFVIIYLFEKNADYQYNKSEGSK